MIVEIHLTVRFHLTRKMGAFAYLISSPQGRIRFCGPLTKVASEAEALARCLGNALTALHTQDIPGISWVRIYPKKARTCFGMEGFPRTLGELYCLVALRRVKAHQAVLLDFRDHSAESSWGDDKVAKIIKDLINR